MARTVTVRDLHGCLLVPLDRFELLLFPYHSHNELRQLIAAVGCGLDPWADELLSSIKLVAEETFVRLRVVTPFELGFGASSSPTREEIYAAAERQDLALCHQQVGLELRPEYLAQPLGEVLFIGSTPIGNPRCPGIIEVSRGDSNSCPRIEAYAGGKQVTFGINSKWVFCEPG